MEALYKKEDKLRCKSGFNLSDSSGGSGYKSGKEIIVKNITDDSLDLCGYIYWDGMSGSGICERALELIGQEPVYEVY